MVLSRCAFGCRNRGGERLGLGFYRFPSKNEDRRRRWSQPIRIERIGSLQTTSTRESVATILCLVSEKCGSDKKSQVSEGIICLYIVGKPVDEPMGATAELGSSFSWIWEHC